MAMSADEQRLQLRAPSGKLRGNDRREAQRDARLRDQPGPHVAHATPASIARDARRPRAVPRRISASRSAASAERRRADGRERVDASDVPTATKKITSTGERAALNRRLQRVALRDRQVLDDEPGGHRRQQRLELLRRADLAEQRARADAGRA